VKVVEMDDAFFITLGLFENTHEIFVGKPGRMRVLA
jgi:hypothetical protein